jgi:hypothetical protein
MCTCTVETPFFIENRLMHYISAIHASEGDRRCGHVTHGPRSIQLTPRMNSTNDYDGRPAKEILLVHRDVPRTRRRFN